jgi:hypothetical protein
MKTLKLVSIALLLGLVMTACATKTGEPAERISLSSAANVTTIEHKGTAIGTERLPQWIADYYDRGLPGVENLADYKGKYCIVAQEYGSELQPLLTWVNNFNAQQQIGATIETRVVSVFKANESKVPDNADSQRKYSNSINSLITGTYTGARKESDWWIKQLITAKGQPDEIRYTALALYTIDQKLLDNQIAAKIEELKAGNSDLSDAFDSVSTQILERGLDWDN